MKKCLYSVMKITLSFLLVSCLFGCSKTKTEENTNSQQQIIEDDDIILAEIDGKIFTTGALSSSKGTYNCSGSDSNFKESTSINGKLTINGESFEVNNNNVYVYQTNDAGEINICYNDFKYGTNEIEDDWYIASESEKTVNDIQLDEKIKSGAFILEVSRDGKNWTVIKEETDIFNDKSDDEKLSYKINPLQVQNNTCFRVTIAYQLMKLDKVEKGFLGVGKKKIYNYSKNIEIFDFSVNNDTTTNTSPDTSPRIEYRDVMAIEKGEGYSKNKQIEWDKDNPQYNEDDRIGYFVLNGYSGNPDPKNDESLTFTKNAGDDITLWFCFNKKIEDIFDLKKDGKVRINDNKKAYDKDLRTNETDFHHGALFIKFTNTEGTPRIIEYYDFLRAVASPLADTKVRIYEEGTYEVVLDYEIKNGSKEYDYKMNFAFEVKNGNCMVFFRDKETTSEISNLALAKNGFTVDFASSKDLEVSFQRSTLIVGANGTLAEDVRENKNVNDFDSFDKEGIYVFTIHNKHTGQTVNKKIYIGNDKYYKALSKNAIEIKDFNTQISNGAKVLDDGTITKEQ